MFAGEPWEPGREDFGVSVNVNGNDLVRTTAQPTTESGRTLKVNAGNSQRVRLERIARARILWDNRRNLAWSTLCGFVFSIVVVLLLPKGFEATTKLMPPGSGSGDGTALMAALATRGTGSMLGGLAGELLGAKGSGPVFVEILESRTVADRLIHEFQLSREYSTTKIEYTRKVLEARTKITEDRKSGVITITVTDRQPWRAAAMAQAYVGELDRLVSQLSTSSARRERIFLEERLKTVKGDLDDAATRFSEFASKNTAIDIPAQGKAMVEAAAVLQGQLIAAEAEASGLEKIYTVNNMRVKALQARIVELREQLQKLGGSTSPAEVRNDNSLYPSIRKLPLLGVTYADLYRRTKIEETVYELLTQQYELAKVQEAKEIPSVKVLDSAVMPTVKSSPHRVALTWCGTTLTFLGAAAWILLRKNWKDIDPADPGRVLAAEMAASVVLSTRRIAAVGSAAMARSWRRKSWRGTAGNPETKSDTAGVAGVPS
jgi:capsule polysaccharide export protein KpsE/RkpR